jgi:hypothetical protein
VDEAIDLQIGLGDEAPVALGGCGGLAEPMAQPGRGLVGQPMGEVVIGSKFGVRSDFPFEADRVWMSLCRISQ